MPENRDEDLRAAALAMSKEMDDGDAEAAARRLLAKDIMAVRGKPLTADDKAQIKETVEREKAAGRVVDYPLALPTEAERELVRMVTALRLEVDGSIVDTIKNTLGRVLEEAMRTRRDLAAAQRRIVQLEGQAKAVQTPPIDLEMSDGTTRPADQVPHIRIDSRVGAGVTEVRALTLGDVAAKLNQIADTLGVPAGGDSDRWAEAAARVTNMVTAPVAPPASVQHIRPRGGPTHTYALMEVSPATFAEVKGKLLEAGYEHAITPAAYRSDTEELNMRGISLVRASTAREVPLDGRYCCYLDAEPPLGLPCNRAAEFEIYQESDKVPDSRTDACGDHVGALLGYRVGSPETGGWVVTPIAPAKPQSMVDAERAADANPIENGQ